MTAQARQRTAALLEVLGVYLTGAWLNEQIANLLIRNHVISDLNPFGLLTTHSSNADLLVASRQLLLALTIIYGSYALLVIPLNWWYRRKGRAAYGLTRAGHPWRALIAAGIATSVLTQWPVLVHTLVDAIHPLGAMAPWRQAFFDMSWRRWQFWAFAGVASYAVIPVVEELLFRGYYQRRLAEDWGDGPAIIGTACLFTFAHAQYLIANAYNITMIMSLLCMAIGLGVVFAWTRSIFPSMIAHAIINTPMTAVWQGGLLVVFAVCALFCWRAGAGVFKQVFRQTAFAVCALLAILESLYVIESRRVHSMTWIAFGLLPVAIVVEVVDGRENRIATRARTFA